MLGWHDTPWMWLSMVAFWSLVVTFAYFWLKGSRRLTAEQNRPQPMELLDARYARGEISGEEYRERHEALEAAAARGRP